ncbi:MAG: bifunctional precorrin-2 dehydrogenase/sirohydrochlorin ferrochelatase [candidate division NC10 bacterium]|nr:bifunctional precorrin-2 dehydrogenase/sirohydrochlorin ferrochelatase [candidate division NC10 bacterium]
MVAYYPLMVDLGGKRCLVVGGGEVAERKVETLFGFGAAVVVVSPSLTPLLEELAAQGRIIVHRRTYQEGDVKGSFLAIGATDDRVANAQLSKEAKAEKIPVNIVDDPELSTFIAPSIIQRGDLVIAISTGGVSPALAKRIRKELEERYNKEYGEFLDALHKVRERAKREIADPLRRKELLTTIARLDSFELFRHDRSAWQERAEALFQQPRSVVTYD